MTAHTTNSPVAIFTTTHLFADDTIDPFRAIPHEQLASLFVRASVFVDARPWERFPLDTPIALDLPQLDLFGACAFLWKEGSKRGVAFFFSYEEYETFATSREMPGAAFVSLDFYSESELHPVVTRRVALDALCLADRDSYPIPSRVEADGTEPELTAADVELCSAVLIGLADVANEHGAALACGEAVQAFVEVDEEEVVLVECPHPGWS